MEPDIDNDVIYFPYFFFVIILGYIYHAVYNDVIQSSLHKYLKWKILTLF